MREIKLEELQINPITLLADNWLALMAGNEEDGYNAMTVSWGTIGVLWHDADGKYIPVCTAYVRPQRYTKQFMDKEEYFTLCDLGLENKKAHQILGSKSGRDMDKLKECGLSVAFDGNTSYIKESKMVFVCKKIYAQDLEEKCFVDQSIPDAVYPEKDFHTTYVGKIVKILVEDE